MRQAFGNPRAGSRGLPSSLLLLSCLVLALTSPAHAQDPDGDIDEESLLERARPMIQDVYLHPDAIDPERMLRSGLQRLEHRSPQILVLEQGEEALSLRVSDEAAEASGSERTIQTGDVDLEEAFSLLESAVLWIHAEIDDPDVTEDDLRVAALTGALRTLDRHSNTIAGDRLEQFNTRYKGTLVGIGTTIGQRDGHLRVVKPFPGTPAVRAGLRPWDVITHVDGVSTEPMSVSEAVDRIRGPEGVPVVLSIERPGEDFTRAFVMVREKVPVPSVDSTRLTGNVGWISIDHFSRKTSVEVVTALGELMKSGPLQGLILDLRGNQGGSMIHAARIVNNFVEEGVLVQTEGRNGGKVRGLTHKVGAQPNRKRYDGPVVVLVDRRTASGSEIVAGGLKFLERGLILGRQTFGKGTVQKVYSLTDDVSMKLTVARYLLPGMKFINSVGVTPDVVTGQLWLDPVDPTVPDEFVEPPEIAGLDDGDGGLDARRNPGSGRAPDSGGINATPSLRLLYPRVVNAWSPEEDPKPESTPEGANAADAAGGATGDEAAEAHADAGVAPPAEAGPPKELQGDEKVRSNVPGDAGDDQFNDIELRLAHEILLAAKPNDRRAELISVARPLVSSWQQRQSERLMTGLAQRDIAWTPAPVPRWLDRAPALDDETEAAMRRPPPALTPTLELPKTLVAGKDETATLVVRNDTDQTWSRVRARLESSTDALDNASFLLGDLAPGAERRAEISLRVDTRDESRLDVWRLYLMDDDGPLGGPVTGTVRTEGLPTQPLHVRVATEIEPEPSGGVVLRAHVSLRNAGIGETGEVRVYFGNPPDETIERTERFRTLDPIDAGAEATGTLSLRIRDPAARATIPISLRASDLRTGDFTTVALDLPTSTALDPSEWYRPATSTLPGFEERGSIDEPHAVSGTVSSPVPLASVEVLVDRDKLFTRRVAPGEDVRTVGFSIDAPIGVGPNLVLVRTKTADGVSSTARRWVLGER